MYHFYFTVFYEYTHLLLSLNFKFFWKYKSLFRMIYFYLLKKITVLNLFTGTSQINKMIVILYYSYSV